MKKICLISLNADITYHNMWQEVTWWDEVTAATLYNSVYRRHIVLAFAQ